MNDVIKILLVLIAVVGSISASAAASVSITACQCRWSLASGNVARADSVLLGVNSKFKLDSMYFGLGYNASRPEFGTPISIGNVSSNVQNIRFSEMGLTLGYYYYRGLSGYVKYQKVKLDYGNQISSTVPGVGILGKHTFTNRWLVFANATYYAGGLTQGDNANGARIKEFVAGTALRLGLYSHVDLSYKLQKFQYTRLNYSGINLEIQGITLSYSYIYW